MENLSRNKKISLGLGIALIISLFMPWVDVVIFSMSLIGVPGALSDIANMAGGSMGDIPFKAQLLVYIGYVFFILGVAGLFFNYKGDIQKAKSSYYAMAGYFVLVIILNISGDLGSIGDMGGGDDGPSFFSILGMGFYVFIASYIGNLIYLKEDDNPEVTE